MSKSNYKSDAEILETAKIRIENTRNQPVIAENMARFGYNEEKLGTGAALLEVAQSAYDFKKQEDYESKEINNKFRVQKESIGDLYGIHRETAKVLFKDSPEILLRLGINGKMPEGYVKWYETITTFYKTSGAEKPIQDVLATMDISLEQINKQKTDLEELTNEHIESVREKGESKDATAKKDKAFADLKNWMSDFKAVARIALKETPQLLDALRIKA